MKTFAKTLLLALAFCWVVVISSRGQQMPEHQMLRQLQTKPTRQVYRPGQPVQNILPAVDTAERHAPRSRTADLPDSVGPLLTDQWDQEGPLRGMTPVVDGEHCVVGCVALAMAQLMHRWQHPEWGTGQFSYEDSLGCGQVLTADFSRHHYEWALMPDKYIEGEYTREQADAGAMLCSDCGISVGMRYGTTSGAQPVQQAIALPTYFGYDEGTQLYFRDFYTKDEITLMLKRELAAGRPVLVSGYNVGGGHAFVIDGYNRDDWFHINVGNPDGEFDGDGWTPLDCMAPNQPAWYDTDSPESGYNLLQIFVLGAIPNTHPEATRTETHVFAMQRIEAAERCTGRSDEVRLCVRDLSNVGRSLHCDSVSIMLCRDGERLCPLYTYDRTFLLEEVDDTTYTDTLSLRLPDGLSDGLYTVQPMFRDGDGWQPVRTSTGTPNYLLLRAEADSVVLSVDSARMGYLTLEDYEVPDLIINGSCPELSLTLQGHNAELAGRIYLLMEPTDEGGKAFYLARQGVSIAPGERSTRRFHKTAVHAPRTGTYRLHFVYEANLFAEELTELTEEPVEVTVVDVSSIQIAEK